jgi:hypothetical protein
MVDAHRTLASLYQLELAPERDTYSLAQPSPFEFIPSYVSNSTVVPNEGE